jgi:hypothetical protein
LLGAIVRCFTHEKFHFEELILVVDCQAAIALITRSALPLSRWKLLHTIHGYLRHLDEVKVKTTFAWVPSHDKVVPSWRPHVVLGEELMRKLNT